MSVPALAGASRGPGLGNWSGREARAESWAVQCLRALGTSALPVSRTRRITYMGPIDRGEEGTRALLENCSLYVLPCHCTSVAQAALIQSQQDVCGVCPLSVTSLVVPGSSGEPLSP